MRRSMDSDSEDSRDADMEANYASSEFEDSDYEDSRDATMEANYGSIDSDDSMDGELARVCRAAGTQDVAIPEAFDSDDDDYGLHGSPAREAGRLLWTIRAVSGDCEEL